MGLFKVREAGSTFMTEVLAGITTFVTMSYIIFANPGILSKTGMDFDALVVVTCLSAALGTFLMALLANYPVALAPGVGLNAYFAFSVVGAMTINGAKVTWQMALAAVFIEGVIFIVLTITSLREKIVNTIPKDLKLGISAGIGFFIAFIGLQGAGLVANSDTTLVQLGSLKIGSISFGTPEAPNFSVSFLNDVFAKIPSVPALLALLGILIIAVLTALKIKSSLLIGILAVTGAGIGLGMVEMPKEIVSMPPSIEPLFFKLDFSLIKSPDFWIVVFTFFFVDFFDTVGTLVGVCSRSNLLDENGNLPRAKGALMADALATVAGAVMGTSTVTSYVESSSGVAQGGRTGLTSVVTALLFLAAMFFAPLIRIVPSYATAPALIIVGVYMMISLKDINYDDWTELVPAFLGFVMMPLTYSISTGIEIAIISYVIIKIFTARFKDISFLMLFLAVLFTAKELFL